MSGCHRLCFIGNLFRCATFFGKFVLFSAKRCCWWLWKLASPQLVRGWQGQIYHWVMVVTGDTWRYCCLVSKRSVLHTTCCRLLVCVQQLWCVFSSSVRGVKLLFLLTDALLHMEVFSVWFVFLLWKTSHLQMQCTLLIESQCQFFFIYLFCKM